MTSMSTFTSNQMSNPNLNITKLCPNKKTYRVTGLMTITPRSQNTIAASFNKPSTILTTIDKEFSQPSEYLNIYSPIQVGRRPQILNQYDSNTNLNSRLQPLNQHQHHRISFVGAYSSRRDLKGQLNNPTASPCRKSLSTSMNISQLALNANDKLRLRQLQYDIIDEKGIRKLFSDIKTQTEFNKLKGQSQVDLTELPKEIKEGLYAQEKSLVLNQRESTNANRLSKYLSKKTKKKEKQLLINNIDGYRLKRQLIETIASNIPDDVKYGVNNWSISLRRPENFKGVRETFINVGSEKKPFWTRITEKKPKEDSCSMKPKLEPFVLEENRRKNSPLMLNRRLREYSLDKIGQMNNLAVNGKNLLQFEYEHVTKVPGRKIVYKKNMIDSMSLGRMSTGGGINGNGGGEYCKSFENLLSEQVICANYKKKQLGIGLGLGNCNSVTAINMTSLN